MSILTMLMMTAVAILFLAVMLVREWDYKLSSLNQTGDSSLSPKSVNWLVAIAFLSAVLICLI